MLAGALLAGAVLSPGALAVPYVFGVSASPNPAMRGEAVSITAYTNSTDGYTSAAEFHVDDPDPVGGTGTPMSADDGAFDGPYEAVSGVLDTGNLSAGEHTICVLARETAWNNSTSWSTCTQYSSLVLTIVYPGTNQAPVADAGGPYVGEVGVPIEFNGSGSYDPDGFLIEFFWTFGDGGSDYGIVVMHTYSSPPANNTPYTVCLRVTDNNGSTDTDCTTAYLRDGNLPPVADAGPDQTGEIGELLTFDGSASYDLDGVIVEHFWTFSDGDTAFGVVVTHTFTTPSDPGNNTHSACLRVTDNNGSTGTDCAGVLVLDPSPAAPRMLPAVLAGPGLADVRLLWVGSSDDGAGENDVVGYDILFGSAYDRDGAGYTLLASVPAGATQYVHTGAGAVDPASHFYLLRAVDNGGHRTRAADQAGKFARSLGSGSQLISIPLEQADWSVGKVLQTVAWSRARTYVNPAGQGRNWLSNDKQKPWADLTTLSRTMAVWVQLDSAGLLAVAGLVPASTSIQLKTGWNFIGYASFTPQSVGATLAGISYQTVEGYALDPPHNLRRLSPGDTMSAGNGFWVHVSVDAVLTLGN